MARITIEDCLNKVNNRFTLIHLAAKRVRQLRKGSEPTLSSKNKDIVVALREIAAGKVLKSERSEGMVLIEPGDESPLLSETAAPAEGEDPHEQEKEA
ncbi:MAG: DNA-directed RNA polymerase subunit omega [Deltaproteobacteria bacterium]|nr:DNA-directed RNA polymerase subunit omega [Deltaproteobacteria bacterium]